MLFVSVEDFFKQTEEIPRLTNGEERALAAQMRAGDRSAREALVRQYLPFAAAQVRRAPATVRTLHTVYACIAEVEKGGDGFDFSQNGETFVHHLSWRLRQCITRCIAEK